MVGGYSRLILHIPRIYIFGFETPSRSMGLLLVLHQVCQKSSEPEVWITELELSGSCVQLCRVHRFLFQSPTRKLLCSYCWPDAYGCNFIYFAVYLFYSIKQQRARGVLHASENFDRLDMHRCWWIWLISYCLSLFLSTLFLFPCLRPAYISAISDTDNPAPSNTRSVSRITIAHTIDAESALDRKSVV